MKKLAPSAFAAIEIGSLASDYIECFNTLLYDGKFDMADSVLQKWIGDRPDDPELYPARFNLLLGRAYNSMIALYRPGEGPEGGIVFSDSTGAEAGSIGPIVSWNDSLYNLAIDQIDCGIDALPERLDFRLGKATALAMHGDWPECVATMTEVLDMTKTRADLWRWTNNEFFGDSVKALVNEAAWEKISELFNEGNQSDKSSHFEKFGHSILEVYPRDNRVLNILGAYAYDTDDSDKALSYFRQSAEADRTDAIPLGNMVYIYRQQGDTARALEICRMVTGSNSYDEECKESFRQMEQEITTPAQEIGMYDYFFSWLPMIGSMAEEITDKALFTTPHLANSRLPEINNMRPPFTDDQIAAETVSIGDVSIAIWRFPEPETVPMCLYAAFVPDCKTYDYYTIEISLDNIWVLGSMKGQTHSNYGEVRRPENAADFVDLLIEKGILTGLSEPEASFTRPD